MTSLERLKRVTCIQGQPPNLFLNRSLLKRTARKNRIEMTHSSNPDPLKQRAVVPCACAVLCSVRRSAEGMRAADS